MNYRSHTIEQTHTENPRKKKRGWGARGSQQQQWKVWKKLSPVFPPPAIKILVVCSNFQAEDDERARGRPSKGNFQRLESRTRLRGRDKKKKKKKRQRSERGSIPPTCVTSHFAALA
jgi:hypothetical protein